jgi:aromatic-L-amino-acid/L-tryptophan decarboxylase
MGVPPVSKTTSGVDPMNPLVLSEAEYRAVFERAAQLSLDYLTTIGERSSFPSVTGSETEAFFSEHLPEKGLGLAAFAALNDVITGVRVNSPRFFGYVFGSGEPVAAAADLISSVLNQNVTAWRSSPSAVTIEKTVVGWLAQAVGCSGFTGSLTAGGSAANLMGLAMARESRLPANEKGARRGTIYASEQVHMSIPKAVALLGIGRDYLRLIPCDDRFCIRADSLRESIARDAAAGLTPVAIIGSAGTVATGSIDPLQELAEIARECGAWFHVDGAYGALAAIAEPAWFAGIEQADSLSLDPHKWLYQPVDCGCLLYRDAAGARKAFSHSGDYAKSLIDDPLEGFAFFEESIELSRRFRALKLWLSLRYHGLEKFRRAIRDDLEHAQLLSRLVAAAPELELLAPVKLSAVCFRMMPPQPDYGLNADAVNLEILRRVVRRGRVYLSNATIQGKFSLRACFVNHRTTADDVEEVVREVRKVGGEVVGDALASLA